MEDRKTITDKWKLGATTGLKIDVYSSEKGRDNEKRLHEAGWWQLNYRSRCVFSFDKIMDTVSKIVPGKLLSNWYRNVIEFYCRTLWKISDIIE